MMWMRVASCYEIKQLFCILGFLRSRRDKKEKKKVKKKGGSSLSGKEDKSDG
jgi:hypothetical protein